MRHNEHFAECAGSALSGSVPWRGGRYVAWRRAPDRPLRCYSDQTTASSKQPDLVHLIRLGQDGPGEGVAALGAVQLGEDATPAIPVP